MSRIELGPEEAGLLRETLESCLEDLRMEIADTDSVEFRNDLKRKVEVLRAILERLPAA